MRWGLLSVRLAIVAVNLLIVAVILLSVVPLATGGLSVELEEEEAPEPVVEDGVVTMSMPLRIYNGGYFDFQDVQVSLRVSSMGILLAEGTTEPVDVRAGIVNRLVPTFTLDLNGIDLEGLSALMFESSELDMEVAVRAAYTMGLVSARVSFSQPMEVGPLVSDLQLFPDAAAWEDNGTAVDMLVPYSFYATPLIHGQTVELKATLRNATAELGEGEVTITVEERNDGTLRITLPAGTAASLMGPPQELIVGLDISGMGATGHVDYPFHWEGGA